MYFRNYPPQKINIGYSLDYFVATLAIEKSAEISPVTQEAESELHSA